MIGLSHDLTSIGFVLPTESRRTTSPQRRALNVVAAPVTPLKERIGFMRNRTFGINIRVTKQEKKRIARFAKKCKLSVSEYLRKLANGYEPRQLPNNRMYDLCWQIELLIGEYRERGDEKFKNYLAGILNDLQKVCNGTKELTETEVQLSRPSQSGESSGAGTGSDERSVM